MNEIEFPEIDAASSFAMAVINLSVEELLQSGFSLPQIITALEDYTKAARIAAENERREVH